MLIDAEKDCLTVNLPRHIDIKNVSDIWTKVVSEQKSQKPKLLVINAEQMEYCDGAGIALLTELERLQQNDKHEYRIEHLQEHINNLLHELRTNQTERPQKPQDPSLLESTGISLVNYFKELRQTIAFIGQLIVIIYKEFRHGPHFRWKLFRLQLESIGPKALPITALLGLIMGLILSFQALVSLERFGATIFTINIVTITLTRELGALMTGVIIAGRTASSFAAEIGTMKINQEIDALNTMGVEPVHYLVLPRILAGTIITPLLSLYLIFFGFFGCYLVMASRSYSLVIFCNELLKAITLQDLAMGLVKATVFGLLITFIGCLHGLHTKTHAVGVGQSTTRAVVGSIVTLGIADAILTMIFYYV